MMAKIIWLNIPGHGHVNPTLPVVQELVRRGHEIIYYNTEDFRAKIEATGATMRAYPESLSGTMDFVDLMRDGNLVKVTVMLLEASEQLVPFLLDEIRREQPAIIIHDSTTLWGSICAKLLGLPSVASIPLFIFEGTKEGQKPLDALRMMGAALPLLPGILRSRARLTRHYGKHIFQKDYLLPVLGGLNIVFTAESLQPPSTVIDDTFRFVGPSINPQTRQGDNFPYEQLNRQPLIYISLGTIHHTHTEFFRTAFEAFRDYPGQFVLSTGGQTDIGPIPDNFIVRDYVPQLEILKRADAFVTHGGMNSIHEGLYYGVPLVLIPHQIEQLFNARVVVSHGAGLVINNLSADGLRASVDDVLRTPVYRERAQAISQVLHQTGGYLQAADELEAYTNSNIHLSQGS
jgi:MGT family glycosyltransferase